MIARHWHGVVRRADETAFQKYLNRTAIPKFMNNPGFMDHHVIKKYDYGIVHFYLVTYWQNWDYIEQFAGDNIDKSQYFDEDLKYLIEKDEIVKHYEVVDHIQTTV